MSDRAQGLVSLERLRAPGAAKGRSCGPCTACCVVLPIAELRKPARRACDHLRDDACGVHPERPASCRAFHCAWLRGALGEELALRPDALGVMIDHFVLRDTGEAHTVAFELWEGAFDSPEARAVLDELARTHAVTRSHRDGRWSEPIASA